MIKTAAVLPQADILEHGMKRILITGAAGKIGNALRQGLRGSYSLIRLADIASLGSTAAGEELATTDIRDMAALEKVMAGIDCGVKRGISASSNHAVGFPRGERLIDNTVDPWPASR